jgi:hypothetical protein
MDITKEDLDRRFNYHQPQNQETLDSHARVREVCCIAAEEIVAVTGSPSREQSSAITKLEEAMFWANAAIARGRSV